MTLSLTPRHPQCHGVKLMTLSLTPCHPKCHGVKVMSKLYLNIKTSLYCIFKTVLTYQPPYLQPILYISGIFNLWCFFLPAVYTFNRLTCLFRKNKY